MFDSAFLPNLGVLHFEIRPVKAFKNHDAMRNPEKRKKTKTKLRVCTRENGGPRATRRAVRIERIQGKHTHTYAVDERSAKRTVSEAIVLSRMNKRRFSVPGGEL